MSWFYWYFFTADALHHWDPMVRSAYETIRLINQVGRSAPKLVTWITGLARRVVIVAAIKLNFELCNSSLVSVIRGFFGWGPMGVGWVSQHHACLTTAGYFNCQKIGSANAKIQTRGCVRYLCPVLPPLMSAWFNTLLDHCWISMGFVSIILS